MLNKQRKKAIVKLLILIVMLILVLRIFALTLSKFESTSNSNADVDIAFYVIKEDFQSMNLNLNSIFPQSAPYVYTFSISNYDGINQADVDIEYNLGIRATTNLPLTYELYLNQNYTDADATNIIKTDVIEQDENSTYFRKFTTDSVTLKYEPIQKNIYRLVVYFPGEYNTKNYQDIIEGIEITLDSKQIK